MNAKPKQRSSRRTKAKKIIWTSAEKYAVVDRAIEIQADHPELAGLPLLRAGMDALKPDRRRKLIALSQAEWFEPALGVAMKLRAIEEKERVTRVAAISLPTDPYIPVLKQIAEATAVVSDAQRRGDGAWFKAQMEILTSIRDEMRKQTEVLTRFFWDGPPPTLEKYEGGRPKSGGKDSGPRVAPVTGYTGRRMLPGSYSTDTPKNRRES
jgi:hypothetical protein